MADPENKSEIGASIPGIVAKILVEPGDKVLENQLVAVIEAMKWKLIYLHLLQVLLIYNSKEGQNVEAGELLIRLE